ncbi:MAG: hypothetical protein FWC42_03950 [Proteobacteria bacterium]|nr:hypothetical protein [Pseudomonadota bacterium]
MINLKDGNPALLLKNHTIVISRYDPENFGCAGEYEARPPNRGRVKKGAKARYHAIFYMLTSGQRMFQEDISSAMLEFRRRFFSLTYNPYPSGWNRLP